MGRIGRGGLWPAASTWCGSRPGASPRCARSCSCVRACGLYNVGVQSCRGVEGYRIYRSRDGACYEEIGRVGPKVDHFVDTIDRDGGTYRLPGPDRGPGPLARDRHSCIGIIADGTEKIVKTIWDKKWRPGDQQSQVILTSNRKCPDGQMKTRVKEIHFPATFERSKESRMALLQHL
jgi:hypothetical protein